MSSTRFSDRRDRVKCATFLREINFGIALRGFETDVPEPAANQIELNASLEEADRAGVSKRVRVDAFLRERRLHGRRRGDRPFHDVADPYRVSRCPWAFTKIGADGSRSIRRSATSARSKAAVSAQSGQMRSLRPFPSSRT